MDKYLVGSNVGIKIFKYRKHTMLALTLVKIIV